MKKSVRPAATKASAERGKSEGAVTAGNAKPAAKNNSTLNKVRDVNYYYLQNKTGKKDTSLIYLLTNHKNSIILASLFFVTAFVVTFV